MLRECDNSLVFVGNWPSMTETTLNLMDDLSRGAEREMGDRKDDLEVNGYWMGVWSEYVT